MLDSLGYLYERPAPRTYFCAKPLSARTMRISAPHDGEEETRAQLITILAKTGNCLYAPLR